MIGRLHYISQETPAKTHLQAIQEACEAGCEWVQLRVKDATEEMYLDIATKAKKITDAHQARLIINDNPRVAKAIQAAGVHLGKEDMPPHEARRILGESAIIGGTANTWEDIQRLAEARVDYIGLGPFRFTTTKKKLSPVLGLEGYQKVIEQCKEHQIEIPVIAIGGIVLEDVKAIRETGVHGIAVSGVITHSTGQKNLVKEMYVALA